VKPPWAARTERGWARARSSPGTRRGRYLIPTLVVFALSGGCRDDADNESCGDCADLPAHWVVYHVSSPSNPWQEVDVTMEVDGEYRIGWWREGAADETPECESSDEGCSGSSLCMAGRLDDDQFAAVETVVQSDWTDKYALDDWKSESDEPVDRSVHVAPADEGVAGYSLQFYSEGPLQPETEVLIDTLDGIALALYARAEYCTDWDRSLAEDGEWVFPITE